MFSSFWSFILASCVSLMSYAFWCVIFTCVLFLVYFLLGDKQEAKFGGLMSVQNTHDISCFIFFLFHFI